MNALKTNDYIGTISSHNASLQSEREQCSIFIQYHALGETAYGCRFTVRRKNKGSVRYDCAKCRKIIDQSVREHKANNAAPIIVDKPAYFMWQLNDLKWIKKRHLEICTMQEYGEAICLTVKNQTVVAKSQYALTCKQAYDGGRRTLIKDSAKQITVRNINCSYKPFSTAKHALNKAHKRKSSALSSNFVDGNKKIKLDSTAVIPSYNLEEDVDHFLIYQSPTGSVVLGTKFLIERFFTSDIAMSDGTFKIAVKGYTQTYILWYLIQGTIDEEEIPRSKAVAAAYFLMKSKSQTEYQELFGALELFR